ncbi:unnamed protein product [Ectocarpus sp. 12 AP-2014]
MRTITHVSPLGILAARGDATILKAFLDKDSDAVLALLDAGAGVNAKAGDNGDCMPLHVAVDRRMSSICTIRALLEGGSDVNVRNDYDHTPLHVACMCINVSAAELLLRCGADEMLKDDDGSTPADVVGGMGDGDLTDEEIETDHQRIRRVLARAPADRSWRRRGWLVLSRCCSTRVHIAHRGSNSGSNGNSNGCCIKVARVSGKESHEDDEETEDKIMSDWKDLVRKLVGLEVDGLFRLVGDFL